MHFRSRSDYLSAHNDICLETADGKPGLEGNTCFLQARPPLRQVHCVFHTVTNFLKKVIFSENKLFLPSKSIKKWTELSLQFPVSFWRALHFSPMLVGTWWFFFWGGECWCSQVGSLCLCRSTFNLCYLRFCDKIWECGALSSWSVACLWGWSLISLQIFRET